MSEQSPPGNEERMRSEIDAGQDVLGKEMPDAPASSSVVPVIGLGGSAGALESLKLFFTSMPADSGAAFVVVPHLPPDHESLMAEILTRYTGMQVVQARNSMALEPNCVYVAPPDHYVGLYKGIFHFAPPVKKEGVRMPIDFFLRSLAEDRHERAICILFSGSGSDGTFGVRAVRAAGGLVLAQDPGTAPFTDMPRSAIATGLVDRVLAPEKMADSILGYLQHPYIRRDASAAVEAIGAPETIEDILALLKASTATDFRYYKMSTISRRIERRMGLHQIPGLVQYGLLLRQDKHEISQLAKDLLINVTSFFRDPEVFEELRLKALTPLVAAKQPDESVRAWVPGCASGEEAYSLAMLLVEELAATGKNCRLQVFATDADEEALEFARQGLYPESITRDISPDRLSRFFNRYDHGYRIGETLRRSVVFAVQNLLMDPPFSRMDLISCRNLLIYLNADTQQKLMPLLNFALNPGGYLLLGKAEGIARHNDLFEIVSKEAKIYRRLSPVQPIILDFPILSGIKKPASVRTPTIRQQGTGYGDAIRQALLGHFSAAVVLVNRKGQVFQFHGEPGKYLNFPTSEPSFNLFDLAKEGLSTRLRTAVYKAVQTDRVVVLKRVPVIGQEGPRFARVTVRPVAPLNEKEPIVAVIFEEGRGSSETHAQELQPDETESVVKRLESELQFTQQDLQSTIEELQVSNEELRVANEEVISSNEELQSTNEELQTSREELQSINEELSTVNTELKEKVEHLDTANTDIVNFLKSTEIATLFLDADLNVKLFTPAIAKIVNLLAADIGRPVQHFATSLVDYDLVADAENVAHSASVIEREVQHIDGSWYLVRIMPYRTRGDQINGVIITMGDITIVRKSKAELERQVEERTVELSQTVDTLRLEMEKRSQIEQALRKQSEQLRQLAAELTIAEQRERQRVARILHDSLQQYLVAAMFRLTALEHAEEERIQSTAADLKDLVRNSIEISHTLTGELSPPILLDVGLIPALEWLGRWMLEKYGLTVHMETRVDSVQITGDVAILLFQAVRELLFNVVKHANTNTARLKVARGDDQIQVSVEDEGIGFDVAQLGPHTGGLGLFSIRERFGYSGGSLEIDTAPGTGCRIELLMPLQASTAQKPGPGSSYDVDYPASAEPERVLTAATKIRVLLADDHDVERKGLARLIMEEPDMEVAGEASDGRAAVEMSRRLHPDVILMDVSMPAMTGVEATRVIHAESPDIRIIALSMYEEPERAAEMRKAGAVDYLAKSGPSEAVVAAIRAVARRPHA